MTTPKAAECTLEGMLEELSSLRADFALPGYWEALEANCEQWASDISAGFLWNEVNRRLAHWRSEYRAETNSDLLSSIDLPRFVAKPRKSVIEKLFRHYKAKKPLREIIPLDGPPIPLIGDLVRNRIRCVYIDGVEFLAGKLLSLANELAVPVTRERQGKIQGYFAQHLNIKYEVTFREAGHGTLAPIGCEIQVASTMASRMWEASHPLYESARLDSADPEDWQWNPNDPRFISNQLGHMIHLADGLLVQLRDSRKPRKE